jgi:hypothetical protein
VRYGISADQRYLTGDFLNTYEATVINGNMVAHIPAALADFLGDRTTQSSGVKPFVIDPLTHAFQHDPSKVRARRTTAHGEEEHTKSSILKMSRAFGEPVSSRVGAEAVVASDFRDPGQLADFCSRVVEFQIGTIEREARAKRFWKYLEYLRIEQSMKPAVVIAPYFWMTPATLDRWLDINVSFIDCALGQSGGLPLFAELVLTDDVLMDQESSRLIARRYGDSGCAGVLLWIDSFSEQEASVARLLAFARLARTLTRTFGKHVINLYGGYFSILLCQVPELAILSGVCHGLEYGEDRSVVPVGGGLPMAKFYLPAYHHRLRYPDAVRAVRRLGGFASAADFHDLVCSCPACEGAITQDPGTEFAAYGRTNPVQFRRQDQVVTLNYPTKETKDLCLRHYLHTKRREFEAAADARACDVAEELDGLYDGAARVLGDAGASYLRNWAIALRTLSSED